MISEKVRIANEYGIHARIAAVLAAECKKYISEIEILVDDKAVNPKNVMELMNGRLTFGKEIIVVCDGVDEADALESVLKVIKEEK
jgi:phosphocarrier protein